MKTPAALAVALALLAAPAARAQPVSARSGPDTYLEFDLGTFIPQAADLNQFDPRVAVFGTFGAMFSPAIGAEASIGYYRAAATTRGTPPQPDTSQTLGIVPVLVNLRLVAPFKAVELSARAGVGMQFATLYVTGASSSYDKSTAFGWQVGASAAFNLSPTMLVGVDVLGSFAEAKFAGATVGLDGIVFTVKLGYRL
jgi:opacity protein-like surface antigen